MTKPAPSRESPICVKTFTEFNNMSDRVVQETFRNKIFVVRDHPTHLKFDLDSLSYLGDINEERTFHGTVIFTKIDERADN